MTECVVRPIRASEWREVRDLRLLATADPDASIAFEQSYEEEAEKPDAFWQHRAVGGSIDAGDTADARQFIAEAGGTWVGTATVLPFLESGLVVGVFVVPEHRGTGLVARLLNACADWARAIGVGELYLHVHHENARARAAYEKCGFVWTGETHDGVRGEELAMRRAI